MIYSCMYLHNYPGIVITHHMYYPLIKSCALPINNNNKKYNRYIMHVCTCT